MEVLVLGPVRAMRDGREIPLNGPRERAVLAALALAGPAGAGTYRIVDQVWGEDAPRTAERTLQAYLSRLRTSLGADVVRTESRRHRLAGVEVDVWRFAELYAHARSAPLDARSTLENALVLWRDPVPVCDATLDGAVVELAALVRDRLDAAELLLGYLDDASVVEAAERIVAEAPHREGAWLRLATSLYVLGRPAEALHAVRRARRHLVGELGLDPSPALLALEADLLNHRLGRQRTGVAPPAPLTPLVGREQLLADVGTRMRGHRLVTLTGTGGIGKTRVAIAAASGAQHTSVHFAALSGATTARAVENTVLTAVGADTDRDDPTTAFAARFERSGALLVLDNCEHVVPVVAALAREILQRCPGVSILATSRTPLGVPGEVLVDVPPLEPETEASALFLARAAEVTPTSTWTEAEHADAVAVCRALDGLPLAIELTARRLRYASIVEVRRDLAEVEPTASGGEARHRTLAAALDWSYAALDEECQAAFRRLALLHGPVPVDVAAAIAGSLGAVEALADSSLVVTTADGVRMYEPVRQYAARKLDPEERSAAQVLIGKEITALAERAAPHLTGPDELHWIGVLSRAHADVRAVLEWAAAHHDNDILTRLAAAVGYLWLLGWGAREAQAWLGLALPAAGHDPVRGQLLVWASFAALRRGDLDEARSLADDAVATARRLGDHRLLGLALHALAQPDKHGAGAAAARKALDEAVAVRRSCGDLAGAAMSLGALADLHMNTGDLAAAAEGYATGLPLMRRSRSPRGLLAYLHSMAELEVLRNNPERAEELAAEARLVAAQTQDVWHVALLALVTLSAARDRHASLSQQRALARALVQACAEQTDPVVTLDGVEAVAGTLLDDGQAEAALRLLHGARTIRAQRGLPVSAHRRARRDADEAAARRLTDLPVTAAPFDVEWLLAAAADALG